MHLFCLLHTYLEQAPGSGSPSRLTCIPPKYILKPRSVKCMHCINCKTVGSAGRAPRAGALSMPFRHRRPTRTL